MKKKECRPFLVIASVINFFIGGYVFYTAILLFPALWDLFGLNGEGDLTYNIMAFVFFGGFIYLVYALIFGVNLAFGIYGVENYRKKRGFKTWQKVINLLLGNMISGFLLFFDKTPEEPIKENPEVGTTDRKGTL